MNSEKYEPRNPNTSVSSHHWEPISQPTRNARRNLLWLCTLSYLITKGGMVPTEVTALGIKLSEKEQSNIVFYVGAGLVYLFVEFVIYSLSDYMYQQAPKFSYRSSGVDAFEKAGLLISAVATPRVIFDFLIPIVFSLYCGSLLYEQW